MKLGSRKAKKVENIYEKVMQDISSNLYAKESEMLESLLSLRYGGPLKEYLPHVLIKPVEDLMGRPRKQVRGRLVELGYTVAVACNGKNEPTVPYERLSQAIEFLHAGSLAVDDVQDGSKMRRGEPTLHLKYGMPIALNTGNWLYFWPLEIIRNLHLSEEQELRMYRYYNRTLTRAHVGQAIDVGLPISHVPQERVAGLCLSSIELKSGALFSLAMVLGAIAGGADDELVSTLEDFGHGFGMGLQMYDDIGNIKGRSEPAKRWEDLMLRRPSWVWACAASHYSKVTYDLFIDAVKQLPQDRRLTRWFEQFRFFEIAKKDTQDHFKRVMQRLEQALAHRPKCRSSIDKLKAMGVEIAKAYE